MNSIQSSFSVNFSYNVHFTTGLFKKNNPLLSQVLNKDVNTGRKKIIFIVDGGVAACFPGLINAIIKYTKEYSENIHLVDEPFVIPGGEQIKNDTAWVDRILEKINHNGICRQSYIAVVGGGAVIDTVSFAAAIAHRGIRHIRIPTTVLSQCDSGIGVKNSINYFNKKNFLGTFFPPYAVLNDFDFLTALPERDWRSGIAEAIKVALLKDADFFKFIKNNAFALSERNMPAMEQLIRTCAQLHINHISDNDPFETGSSRPLDFGHWSAHKLEQISNYSIRHGEAVAIGIALDITYSYLMGLLPKYEWETILQLISSLGFKTYLPQLLHCKENEKQPTVLNGLDEFREHLGGILTVMLLEKIGKGTEVNKMKKDIILDAINLLKLHCEENRDEKVNELIS